MRIAVNARPLRDLPVDRRNDHLYSWAGAKRKRLPETRQAPHSHEKCSGSIQRKQECKDATRKIDNP